MTLRSGILWLALAAAFSPLIVNLAEHWAAAPWARYGALFVPLLAIAVRRERERPEPARDGLAWIALALALELGVSAGGFLRVGRVALPIAWLGACRLLGLAPWRTALLGLWIVPAPDFLHGLASDWLGPLLARVASAVPLLLGAPVEIGSRWVRIGDAELAWLPSDAGLVLVGLLAGLGWYAALRRGLPVPGCVRTAVRWGCLGIPLQALGLGAAMGLVVLGGPSWGRALLDHGLWLAVAGAGLLRAERAGGEA